MAIRYGTKPVTTEREVTWVICNTCGQETEVVNRGDVVPMPGWFTLRYHEASLRQLWQKDLCSRVCLQREVLGHLRPPEDAG